MKDMTTERSTKTIVTLLFLPILVAAVLTVRRFADTALAAQSSAAHAANFIKMLQAAGVVVNDVKSSPLQGVFQASTHAAYVVTNLGVVEVAVFEGEKDAESLWTMGGTEIDNRARRYYEVNG